MHAGTARSVEAFFVDMQAVFAESYRVLKSGGRCCYVIGNTQLRGVVIPNGEVFAELLQGAGFELERLIKREIPLKTLPQVRDARTGRFAKKAESTVQAYPTEYIVIARK